MADFLMPKLGADMSAGTLVCWHKQPGDRVHRGDVIATVETEKGAIDVEAFVDGIVERLVVGRGESAPVGAVLAMIREEGGANEPPVVVASHPSAPVPASRAIPEIPLHDDAGRLRASPSARALAQKLGVELNKVPGTGPHGSITREDVERVAASSATPAPILDRKNMLRQTIAAAMSRSKREIPHYYLSTTIDMHAAMTWVGEQNNKRPVTDRLLPGVLLLKAVALALREVPELNAVWAEQRVIQSPAVHVGVAIALRQGGLIAPALHDTDRQSLDDLMRSLRDLVNRTRAGSLRSSELSDPTITVTSLGDQGVETVFGVIYPPQVAIVGFGKIVERPWSVNGQIVSRPVLTATLSADHRVSDGHRGGLFLAAVDRLLQEPQKL